ncbi:ribonuclease H-like domain-containing protein [Tanacetum coccineum]
MTRSSTKELLSPFENPEQKFLSKRRLFDTPSLIESNSPEFDHIFDIKEQSKEGERETMTKMMEHGSEHEDANEHIEKVLEIVDLFHILKVTQDQIMLRAFPVSLTRAEPDESLFRAWERFKELLMKCPQHYLTDMQEVILFYNGLDVPTRQILDSKCAIPSKIDTDAKIAIQEMTEYSQKWHNGTSSRKPEAGCELCKGPHYTKDCPQKEEGKTLEEAYYTQFGSPYQPGGQYRAAGPGFYQRKNGNSSYPDRRPSLEESLTKFMAESAKRHEKNSNIIKKIRASTDAAIRNQGASIKTLEIQIEKSCKREGLEACPALRRQTLETSCDDWREAQDVKILDTYDHSLPQKEKDIRSFTLPCLIHNICFDKALVDLGASVSVMPFSTYTNLGLGILSHTRLTIELANQTIKQPRGIAKNVLVRIGKFIFPIDFIILDIPEDNDVPLILGRPFLSTAHSKIDVFKRKITLRVGEEKLVFKSVKPATSIIKRVFVIKSLDSKTNFIKEGDESFDPIYGGYIELNNLDTPLETKTDRDDFVPIFVKTGSYKMEFSCVIGYKYVITDLLPSLPINLMSKSFYYSIFGDKDEGKSHAGTLIDIPVFVGSFSIISGFTIIDDDDMTKDVVLGMKFCKKYASCQRIMKRFALGNNCERIMEDE